MFRSGTRIYRYTATAVTATATSAAASRYVWLLPTFGAASKDSSDIASDRIIKVKYTSNAASGDKDLIGVQPQSNCSNSTYVTMPLGIKAKTGCSAARLITPAATSSDVLTRVYPNPTNGNFTISFQSKAKAATASI